MDLIYGIQKNNWLVLIKQTIPLYLSSKIFKFSIMFSLIFIGLTLKSVDTITLVDYCVK